MIGILGGGLAGLCAGYHLQAMKRNDFEILEKNPEPGGLCRSWSVKGYTFDYGPHIIYTANEYAKSLFARFLKKNLERKLRENYIYLYKTVVKYPFETFLHGLPPDVIMECLEGVMEARAAGPAPKSTNFLDWIMATFGKGIAKHYFIPYNQKVWKHPLEKMSIDWIFGRVPSPDLKDMMRGALGIQNQEFGPNAMFEYPKKGGIGSLPNAMAASVSSHLRLESEITGITPRNNRITVGLSSDGKTSVCEYDRVISTLPLPELVALIDDAPSDIARAARALVFTRILCMGIGVKRKGICDKHSLYYPEKEFLFNRISFPMNMASSTAPRGRSSILAEVTCRKDERPDIRKSAQRICGDLRKAGILRRTDTIEYAEIRPYSHGYVVYDLDHRKNVDDIHGYLRSIGIIPAGRFGEWEYFNMDKTMLSGKKASEEVVRNASPSLSP